VRNQVKDQLRGYIDKSVHRIIYDFLFVQSLQNKLYGTKIAIFIRT